MFQLMRSKMGPLCLRGLRDVKLQKIFCSRYWPDVSAETDSGQSSKSDAQVILITGGIRACKKMPVYISLCQLGR